MAIGLTSPLLFGKAMSLDPESKGTILDGMFPRAMWLLIVYNKSAELSSSKITWICSYLHPDGPHPDPFGADLIMFVKVALPRCGELSDDDEGKSTGISSGVMTSTGCLDLSFWSTSSVSGANP